jgi:hypothetical protein
VLATAAVATGLIGAGTAILDAAAAVANGTGTMTVTPTSVVAGSTGTTLTFTYTATSQDVNYGTIELAVPTGWTTPQTTSSSSPGYVTATPAANSGAGPETNVAVVSGSTINIEAAWLNPNTSLQITYADASAPATNQPSMFNASESSSETGTVTPLATSPTVDVYTNGTGTMKMSPSSVTAGSTGNALTFSYVAASPGLSKGTVTVAVPAGFSSPQTRTSSDPGYASASGGTGTDSVSVSGSAITVSGVTLPLGGTLTVTDADSGAPPSDGADVFSAAEAFTSTGSPTPLAVSPSLSVTGASTTTTYGNGTVTISSSAVPVGSTGNTLSFSYVAGSEGTTGGVVTVLVPSGWSAPQTSSSSSPGYASASGGTGADSVSASGSTITVSGMTLPGSGTLTVTYADATAPSSAGTSTFTTSESDTSGGTPEPLETSPSVGVFTNGAGTMTVSPSSVENESVETYTFNYTAAQPGLADGSIEVTFPAGGYWGVPADLCRTSVNGGTGSNTVSFPGSTTPPTGGGSIEVSGVTLPAGGVLTLTCSGESAADTDGTYTLATAEAYDASGPLTALATSPTVTVTGADGSGVITASPSQLPVGATGRNLTFTYSPEGYAMTDGSVELTVPTSAGWTTPQISSSSSPGYASASGGSGQNEVIVSGSTIEVLAVTLADNQDLTISYADVSAPTSGQQAAFNASAESSVTGSQTALASPATIAVYRDGSGTMTMSPSSEALGSQSTLTFSYVAASPGLVGSTVEVVVPAGWSAPDAGATCAVSCVTASGGSGGDVVSINGASVVVSGVTLPNGGTLTIAWTDPTPLAAGSPFTFTTSEAYPASDTPVALAASPTITVTKGIPTVTVTNSSPTTLGSSVTFTATVSGGGVTPTGTVTWSVSGSGGATTCSSSTAVLSANGTATCTITVSAVGTYIVSAAYGGDGNYSSASSPADTISVSSVAGNQLASGAELAAGQSISSTNGAYTLAMQNDGNLVQFGASNIVWSSGTTTSGSDAVMQSDGNLVVYSPTGTALWASNTAGNAGATLLLRNDGEIIVESTSNIPLWAESGILVPGAHLNAGQTITAPDGTYRLSMQSDGNLVEYTGQSTAVWATGTSTSGAFASMQSDGNLVVYNPSGAPLWASNTAGNSGAYVVLGDDGELAVDTDAGAPVWGAPGTLVPGAQLSPGQSISAPDGEYTLAMQSDGDLVEFDSSGPVFATGTSTPGSYAVMQSDGNFVVYNPSGAPLWASNTAGDGGAYVVLGDNGVLSVLSASGAVEWSGPAPQ